MHTMVYYVMLRLCEQYASQVWSRRVKVHSLTVHVSGQLIFVVFGLLYSCTLSLFLFFSLSTSAKIAALEAKLRQMEGEDITNGGSVIPDTTKRPGQSYHSHERIRRKHGGNIKIQRPERQCR